MSYARLFVHGQELRLLTGPPKIVLTLRAQPKLRLRKRRLVAGHFIDLLRIDQTMRLPKWTY